MTISYNIATGTVTLDITPAEIHDMADDTAADVTALYKAIVNAVERKEVTP